MCMTQQEKCPECGTEFPEIDWDAEELDYALHTKGVCVALAHQINGHEDVALCSLKCLVGYLKQHGTEHGTYHTRQGIGIR